MGAMWASAELVTGDLLALLEPEKILLDVKRDDPCDQTLPTFYRARTLYHRSGSNQPVDISPSTDRAIKAAGAQES